MSPVDYEKIWTDLWGDMQRYGPTHRHRRRMLGRMIRELPFTQISTIADVGCGEGSNLLYWAKQFPKAQLFGFDVSQTALDRAKARVKATYAILDVQKGQASRQFDFVTCAEVIEHLEDDLTAIKNIYAMTNRYALFSTVQGPMREFEKSIGHVRSYLPGELKQKLESAGFIVRRIIEWGYPFYSPIYRDLFTIRSVEGVSHGGYGFGKKLLCHILYGVFFLNRMDRGDVVFALAKK